MDIDQLPAAIKQFQMTNDVEASIRRDMLDDLRFCNPEYQWPSQIRSDRESEGRPCLTIPRIMPFISQVANQQRANRPAVQVNPLDSGADPATAECFQGVMRFIENNSDADVAYSTACEFQLKTGRGYWRVMTQYVNDDSDSFDQDIMIRRVRNPFTIYVDPTHTLADASDARFAFVIEDVPKDTFAELYGRDAMVDWMSWADSSSRAPEWMPEGCVRVAEYYYKKITRREIVEVRLPDVNNPRATTTQTFRVDELPKEAEWPSEWKVINRRERDYTEVKWAKITPVSILDSRDWPSKYLPIVQVLGQEVDIDGKVDLRGMVRDAKDPQRMLNFWASALTEIIALTPRAPYIGVEGQFSGHENKWNTANRRNYGYLEYKNVSANGQPVGPPQRQQFSAEIQSIVEAFQLSDNDLKAVMQMYDASLGKSGPEQSGRAILARQRQGDIGNSNYLDNLARAIRYTGRILIDMIPRVYGPVRVLRILGVDEKPRRVAVHVGQPKQDIEALQAAEGLDGVYDIGVGRYDITITTGPSYASRRQEAVDSMMQLLKEYPAAAPAIAHLVVKNMDWPGAAEIAAILKRMVPPQLLQDGPPPLPPEVQQHIQQLTQQVQALEMEKQSKLLQLGSEERIESARLEVRQRLAEQDRQLQLILAEFKQNAVRGQTMLDSELAAISQRLDRMHQVSMASADAAHEHLMADADHARQVELQSMQAQSQPGTPVPANSGGATFQPGQGS